MASPASSADCMLAFLLLTLPLCRGQSAMNESFLIREVLLKNYDPFVRPVTDPELPVYMTMSVGIKSFIDLDMKKQTLVSFGWLIVNWVDQQLSWDVDQFPYRAVYLSTSMIWRPELVVFNTVNSLDELENQKIKVIVRHDGKITWFPGGLLETKCSVNIMHYPLDTQTCSIDIIPWSLDNSLLNATFNVPTFDVANTDRHPEWELVGTDYNHQLTESNYWIVSFRFKLRRKILFYAINVIMPIVLLSLMNCLVFLLPVHSGEKMTVSVTVFLSFAVFMTLINDSLPQNSDSLCLFSAYVAAQMMLSVCSIFMAAVIVHNSITKESVLDQYSGAGAPAGRGSGSRRVKAAAHGSALSCPSSPKRQANYAGNEGYAAALAGHLPGESCSTDLDSRKQSHYTTFEDDVHDRLSANSFSITTDTTFNSPASTSHVPNGSSVLHTPTKPARIQKRACSCCTCLWNLLFRGRLLSDEDRREMCRELDKCCFFLTIALNLVSGLIFIALMKSV